MAYLLLCLTITGLFHGLLRGPLNCPTAFQQIPFLNIISQSQRLLHANKDLAPKTIRASGYHFPVKRRAGTMVSATRTRTDEAEAGTM